MDKVVEQLNLMIDVYEFKMEKKKDNTGNKNI